MTIEKGSIKTYEFYDSTGKQLIEFKPTQNKMIEYIYLVDNKEVADKFNKDFERDVY